MSSCIVLSVPAPGSTPQEPLPSLGGATLMKAFVVPVSEELSLLGEGGLWRRVREFLPPHCMPDAMVNVKAFPMTPHGKV